MPLTALEPNHLVDKQSAIFELSRPVLTPRSQVQLQEIAWRMLSIPDLVCATSDGAGLLLPLENLQVRPLCTRLCLMQNGTGRICFAAACMPDF